MISMVATAKIGSLISSNDTFHQKHLVFLLKAYFFDKNFLNILKP